MLAFRGSVGYDCLMGEPDRQDDVPPVWEWMAQQHNNTDPERAEAARYVSERWQYGPWYSHRKVLSTLTAEKNEHLHGFQLLTQDFVELFDIGVKDQLGEHRLGVVSPLVPVGREQCTHTYRSGKQCKRDSVPGAGLCGDHGGSWISEAERALIVERVSARLVDISERAVATMADLMDNARSEKVRGDMAIAILDRIGVGPITKMELDITNNAEDAATRVRDRMEQIRERRAEMERREAERLALAAAEAAEDIVDGDVVEDRREEPSA